MERGKENIVRARASVGKEGEFAGEGEEVGRKEEARREKQPSGAKIIRPRFPHGYS